MADGFRAKMCINRPTDARRTLLIGVCFPVKAPERTGGPGCMGAAGTGRVKEIRQ